VSHRWHDARPPVDAIACKQDDDGSILFANFANKFANMCFNLQTININKQLMHVSIKYIAEQVVAAKAKNNGRVPLGYTSQLLKEGHETFPKISMKTINDKV
jgi:hypothetical protein